tara:strand:- start:1512 stop:2288 length:777 start_codon:yes stop_codon:yes gene_type:complete
MKDNKKFKPLKMKRVIPNEEGIHKLNKQLNPILPNIEKKILMVIYGSVSTGKSEKLINLLYNDEYFNDCFSMKYIVSPTLHTDLTTSHIFSNDDTAVLIPQYSDDAIREIIKNQEPFIDEDGNKYPSPFSALILEDAVDMKATGSNHSEISKLCTNYRHRNIGLLVIVAQAVNQVCSLIRANVRSIMLCKMRNEKELEKFESQYAEMCNGVKNFRKIYNYVFKTHDDRFNFVYFNFDNNEVYKNFEELLYKDEEMYIN